MARVLKIVRIIWITSALCFMGWLVYSMQSRGFPATVLTSDDQITVTDTAAWIGFIPTTNAQTTGFLFYPGALVDPLAYAPLARQLAEQQLPVYIIKLPFRSAAFGQQEATVFAQTRQLMTDTATIAHWVLGGHSRGGGMAARFARLYPDQLQGLILIGTSLPKEKAFDLSNITLPVMKIYATFDGLASVAEVQANSRYLPPDTTWVEIQGGNHAQFAYYGSQLGDNAAEISRAQQQALTLAAILAWLRQIGQIS